MTNTENVEMTCHYKVESSHFGIPWVSPLTSYLAAKILESGSKFVNILNFFQKNYYSWTLNLTTRWLIIDKEGQGTLAECNNVAMKAIVLIISRTCWRE